MLDGYVHPIHAVSNGGVRIYEGQRGLTLRDHIACNALLAMIASTAIRDRSTVDKDVWAKVAYDFADAMMRARKGE